VNQTDEIVDCLLKGLRNAEPPAGMEARILHAMESRATKSANWRPYATVAACLSLAAMWCIATVKLPPPPAMPMYNPSLTATQLPSTQPRLHRVSSPAKRTPPAPAQLASFPAPPLPLTDQEKLLLRLAHQRDATNMAALNPAVHDAQIAKANEQFQKFFDIEDQEMRRQSE
jgi:hypothetical protein